MLFSSELRYRPTRMWLLVTITLGVLLLGSVLVGGGRVYAAGTTYYVATGGSDSNPGSASQPFQHIQHCASVAQAGDTCLVNAGTYHEEVIPANSGSSGSPITFAPVSGDSVTIDGADPVTGWSLSSGNIYQASATLPVSGPQSTGFLANQVFVDGQMINEASWPDQALDHLHPVWATAGSGSSTTTLNDSNLPAINWTGATLHISGGSDPFSTETGTVTASSSGQLTISGLVSAACPYICLQQGTHYYLTLPGGPIGSPAEWSYNGSSHTLSLWTLGGDSPTNHTVEAKQRNYAFDLSGRSYINISGFNLFASTITTSSSSNNDTIDSINAEYLSHYITMPAPTGLPQNDDFDFIASHELDSGIVLDGTNDVLSNSVLVYSAGNGVLVQGSYNTVTNTLIHDVDYMGGYAAGIDAAGSNQTITHNTIYNTGRDNITVDSHINGPDFQNNTISYNDLSEAGVMTADNGDLYACCSLDASGTSIDHNWAHDLGYNASMGGYAGAGIYIDNNSGHFLVHHNVTWNDQGAGIYFNGQGGASEYNLVYNNTSGGGQNQSLAYPATQTTGVQIVNNIFTGSADSPSGGATISHNLTSSTNPQFVNGSGNDYHLQSGSPAIDAGQVVSGITDGYYGSAPDEGAYEFGGANWVPGCTLSACASPLTVDDAVQGSGQNQFNYSGSGWNHCSGSCGGPSYFDSTISYDNTTNDSVTVAFTGVGIRLYAGKWSGAAGIAAISIDGGSETNVDFNTTSVSAPNALVWSSPVLSQGSHTLKVRVTGSYDSQSSSAYIPVDSVQIVKAYTSVDDAVQGSGQNQFNYSGSGWNHCSGYCGGPSYYGGTISYDDTTNDSFTVAFTGQSIRLFVGEWGNSGGIAAVSLDGGAETNIDVNSTSGTTVPDALVWQSPTLSYGSHTLKVRITGLKDSSSSDTFVTPDRVDILS